MSSGVTSCSPSPQEQPFATIGTEALSSPSVRSLSLSSASGFRPVLTLAQHRCTFLLPQPPSYLLTRRGRPQPGSPPRVLPPRTSVPAASQWFLWNAPKSVSRSVVSDSLQPHGLEPTRLLCPQTSPGKKTGVGSNFLLQGIFPTQGSNPGLPHCRQIRYHLSHQGSPETLWVNINLRWNSSHLSTSSPPEAHTLLLPCPGAPSRGFVLAALLSLMVALTPVGLIG